MADYAFSSIRPAGFTSPLVGEVGSHCKCDPGEGLSSIDRPEPLTPTLSHKGRGGSPPSLKHRCFISSFALPHLILFRIEPRGHLPVFHQPPWRDREHAAMRITIPVGHSLMGPHHARMHGVDGAVVI